MISLESVFLEVDDFCQVFVPEWEKGLLESNEKSRNKPSKLSYSEVMTIVISFHQMGYRNFKTFYIKHVCKYFTGAFPDLVSYSYMVRLIQSVTVPLCAFLTHRYDKPTGIAFVDATKIQVCHNLRIPRHKVFKGEAKRGKTSTGWFYGFKLHLIINDQGGIISVKVTPGNVDDRNPVPEMCKDLWGALYGDKGYISSPLEQELKDQDVTLITDIKKNMKPRVIKLWDKLMLRKRFVIETVFDQLKNISQIEHSRHRSLAGFMVNLIGGLIAYTFQPKKPAISLSRGEKKTLNLISD